MNERMKFVVAYEEGMASMAELCRRFSISRKTGYKWLHRFYAEGPRGLEDRSSRPRRSPQKVSDAVENAIVGVRKRFPDWGPKKIAWALLEEDSWFPVPALSTIGDVLKRNGLIVPRRRRQSNRPPATKPFAGYDEPNAVWCADFKGDFGVGRTRCYPLTVIDGYSRFLIVCKAMSKVRTTPVRHAFMRAFMEFGLPAVIRTDNGPPFASRGAGGLSRLSAWWVTLGITPERIQPGHPEQNGRQERFHRTLGNRTARPPKKSLSAQQRTFDRFRAEYNELRPHEALGQIPPARVYCASPREMPWKRQDPEYPEHYESYRTDRHGAINWRGRPLQLNSCLDREVVGVTKAGEAHFDVYFGPVWLGRFTKPNSKTRRMKLITNSKVLPTSPV